jgi:hypothetical protein
MGKFFEHNKTCDMGVVLEKMLMDFLALGE